jgi:hypothetical protein
MAVTVDQKVLSVSELGLRTVGQVLAHLQRDNRLVVHMLIDGTEPDLGRLSVVRREAVDGHELFIETADPRELATEALLEVVEQLKEADRLRLDATELLGRNSHVKAMEKLSGCFSTWHHAQESVLKTAQLLRIDLSTLLVDGLSLTDMLTEFTTQLRDMKRALENRDFVLLNDILSYEATRASTQWREAIGALRRKIAA